MRAMTLRLPDEVHEALRREAYESRRSMNEVVLDALVGRLDQIDSHLSMREWSKRHPVDREGSK